MHTSSVPSRIPPDIHGAQDYERLAAQALVAPSLAYIAGGSGHDRTAMANRDAFAEWAVCPRLLCDLTDGHTRTRVGEQTWAQPIGLAPVAFQQLAHPQGERETARAAAATDTCLLVSTLSSVPLEDVAALAGPQRWFQLYFQPREEHSWDLLRRAEAAGYEAIVVTLDAAVQTASLRALRAGFRMPADITAANLATYAASPETPAPGSAVFQNLMRQAPRWSDLDALLARSRLPVWVKGVLHPEDAKALQARGVTGLVVSNHGGRSLDGAPASLRALPAIRAAVGADMPLLLDGGVRNGTDVFKALALGANAVLVGRLQMYALSVAGALGVAHMLKLLREELEVCMAQAGCTTTREITADALMPQPLPFASHGDTRC